MVLSPLVWVHARGHPTLTLDARFAIVWLEAGDEPMAFTIDDAETRLDPKEPRQTRRTRPTKYIVHSPLGLASAR